MEGWAQVAALGTLVVIANGGFVWVVRWLLSSDRKKMSGDFEEIKGRLSTQDKKHEELRKEFSQLEKDLPKEYVRREDWIISFSRIDQKLDAIWKFIHEYVNQIKR